MDLGLQAHKVKCMVHEDFKYVITTNPFDIAFMHITCVLYIRLVLIAEKNTVYENFPIPLISRLEKHYVVTSSVFNDWQNDVLVQLIKWITKFSEQGDYER